MHRSFLHTCCLYAAVLLIAVVTLAPLAWLVIMSVMSPRELLAVPLNWLPEHWDWSRYAQLLGMNGDIADNLFLHALRNSLIAASGSAFIALLTGIPAAYAFSRRNGPRAILFLMLATFMMPPITYILPLYTMFSGLGMLNSPFTLIAVYCTMVLPFATWLMKSNLDVLPVEVEHAAVVEGAGTLRTLWSVVLPMAKPALVATAMLSFLLAWDEFFYSLILNSDLRGKTLPVAIADFAAGRVTDYGLIAAVGVLASLPPTLLAVFFQKHLVHGLAAGGVKG
ncbi:carbohydrate ABC transporter permease [Pseudodesulfovibrio tunisiensis]|uniref:carbohydrate ABC transporter permease n=1 Tax=Pseudodesulfovibrio tunisiensis TaxID=463192 RepID=UPI001FB407FF|nr:carbohydrate ABC transporter permease [Pseudodesulfovibrio tunisiensis]